MHRAENLAKADVDIWASHWIYWVGPCIGTSLAGLAYNFYEEQLKKENEKPQSDLAVPMLQP